MSDDTQDTLDGLFKHTYMDAILDIIYGTGYAARKRLEEQIDKQFWKGLEELNEDSDD